MDLSKVTIDDVAKKVNISKSTVSQYLNKRFEYMSLETKNKIEKAIAELNYRPNALARGLKQKKTMIIGVILPNVLYSFSSQIYRAIEDYLAIYKYHVIFCNSDDDAEKERIFLEMLVDKQVDGLIVFPTNKNHDIFRDLLSKKFPIVLIGREITGIPIDIVMLNNKKASYDATNLLIENGHNKIGFISQPQSGLSSRIDRLLGYKKALRDHKIAIKNDYIYHVPLSSVKETLGEMLSLEDFPTALVLGNDLILKEYLEFIQSEEKNDIVVPQIVVFDQNPYLNYFLERISSITHPTLEMGQKAAEILLEKLNSTNNQMPQKSFIFEGKLENRNSLKDT